MKNLVKIIAKIKSFIGQPIVYRRDYLLNLLIDMLPDKLNIRCGFIDGVCTPFKSVEANGAMEELLDGIYGYFIYLTTYNQENYKVLFLNTVKRDILGFIKDEVGFTPRTNRYAKFLKSI